MIFNYFLLAANITNRVVDTRYFQSWPDERIEKFLDVALAVFID